MNDKLQLKPLEEYGKFTPAQLAKLEKLFLKDEVTIEIDFDPEPKPLKYIGHLESYNPDTGEFVIRCKRE